MADVCDGFCLIVLASFLPWRREKNLAIDLSRSAMHSERIPRLSRAEIAGKLFREKLGHFCPGGN